MTNRETPDRRTQIRRVLAEADGFGFASLEPHDYQRHADAILALFEPDLLRAQAEAHQYRTALEGVARKAAVSVPPPAPRAVWREAAVFVEAMNEACDSKRPCESCTTREDVADALRLVADVPVPPPAPRADGRAALRDRIARAIFGAHSPGIDVWDTAGAHAQAVCRAEADAVLAVLPEPADQADRVAVLAEVADWLKAWRPEFFERWAITEQERYEGGVDDAAAELRRWADEAQQPEPPSVALARQSQETLIRRITDGPCVAGEQQNETPEAATVHAVPLPGSNGISSCCGRPPCEFVGERVTRDLDKVTCPGPAAEVRQDGATP